ncbi:MAG: RICIN domain-containing protein [Cyanobacteria bacterium J06638_20]
MKKKLSILLVLIPAVVLGAASANAISEFNRLRTQFTGSEKCLDIINDGANDQLIMADCADYSGQFWSFQPIGSEGYYRLRTMFTGEDKCLDIINDGMNDQLIMVDCGNYSGQLWQISDF